LWPFFDQNASLNHVISICLIVNEKSRQHVCPWGKKIAKKREKQGFDFCIIDAFGSDSDKFTNLFQRVIHLLLDGDVSMSLQCSLLVFLIQSFQSLENQLVCTESLKLVTIGIWSNLAHESRRENILDEYPPLRKLWNSANKKFTAAGKKKTRD
jgi:intron-binding protein aquarius